MEYLWTINRVACNNKDSKSILRDYSRILQDKVGKTMKDISRQALAVPKYETEEQSTTKTLLALYAEWDNQIQLDYLKFIWV
jgi:hypothetical protein